MLWNQQVHCRVHKSPLLISIQYQMNPVHKLTFYFLEIHLLLSFPPIYAYIIQIISFLQVFVQKHCMHLLYLSCVLMPCPSHPLDLTTLILFGEKQVTNCEVSLNIRISLQPLIISSHLGPNILPSILSSDTLAYAFSTSIQSYKLNYSFFIP
jgi:hypothetical protein